MLVHAAFTKALAKAAAGAARYEMGFAAVQKHVAVLERTGLVQKRAQGREQLVSTNRARLHRAAQLLDHFENIWRQRMAQLDDVLLQKRECDTRSRW